MADKIDVIVTSGSDYEDTYYMYVPETNPHYSKVLDWYNDNSTLDFYEFLSQPIAEYDEEDATICLDDFYMENTFESIGYSSKDILDWSKDTADKFNVVATIDYQIY